MEYPVTKLNPNITCFLNKVITADILGAIETGLENEISTIDQGGHITDYASIAYNPLDKKSYVRLSMAYGQFLWLICDVAIKMIDHKIIVDNCIEYGITQEQFLQYTQESRKLSTAQIAPILPPDMRHLANGLIAYFALIPELLNNGFRKKVYDEFRAAISIANTSIPIDEKTIFTIDISTPYSERVNSLYCYGIAFLLLHEQSHHMLNHLQRSINVKDEENADSAAFWSIYSDINDNHRFSANCAILSVFFSFLIIDPLQKNVDCHPKDYKRMFYVYDQIKDENPKYTVLVKAYLDMWAKQYEIKGYPLDLPECESSVDKIREFMETNI